MKNLTWQNPEQLFVAQELINKVKSKCCGIKVSDKKLRFLAFDLDTISFELGDYPLFPLNILCYMYTKGLKVLDKLLTVNY